MFSILAGVLPGLLFAGIDVTRRGQHHARALQLSGETGTNEPHD